jgi:hypothetical protein
VIITLGLSLARIAFFFVLSIYLHKAKFTINLELYFDRAPYPHKQYRAPMEDFFKPF